MAQDDPNEPPAPQGGPAAPAAPVGPDTHHIAAPAATEAPQTEPKPKPDKPVAATGDAPAGAAQGDEGSGAAGATEPGDGPNESELRDEIERAKRTIQANTERLAALEAERKAQQAASKAISDYAAERPSLLAHEEDLRKYRAAEASFLAQFLDQETIRRIEQVESEARAQIDRVAARIAAADVAGAAKRDIEAAKAEASAAKRRADALKRPAAAIRDRLAAADALRSEAKKASDAGNYALAYWLIMDGGPIDRKLREEPSVLPPSDLKSAADGAAAAQAEAEGRAARLQDEAKQAEASLQADRAELAKLTAGLDSRVRTDLAALNPKPAEAA